MNKRILTLTITGLILVTAVSAYAWRGGAGGHGGYGGWNTPGAVGQNDNAGIGAGPGYGPLAAVQSLPAEKQEAAKAMWESHREKMTATFQELRAKNLELQGLLASSSPDKARIDALTSEIATAQSQLLRDRVDFRLAFKAETGIDMPATSAMSANRGGFAKGQQGFHGRGHGMRGQGMNGQSMRGQGNSGRSFDQCYGQGMPRW